MKWKDILNALADGIEMKLNMQSHLDDVTTEHTTKIARILKIPEIEISNWAQERTLIIESHHKDIDMLLKELCKNTQACNIISNFVKYKVKGGGELN